MTQPEQTDDPNAGVTEPGIIIDILLQVIYNVDTVAEAEQLGRDYVKAHGCQDDVVYVEVADTPDEVLS